MVNRRDYCSARRRWSEVFFVLAFAFVVGVGGNEIFFGKNRSTLQMREEVKEMFYHAYNGYLKHAFPFDQLGPVTCRPYTKKASDFHLGGFGLSAIESLSTLAILGNKTEFKKRGTWLMHHLKFTDKRVVLSVFEANIRMVGGLLSAHLLVEDDPTLLPQYAGQFLSLARELGQELLHAFKTVDGIPHKRIHLGAPDKPEHTPVTSLADAGTFLLEFQILSRLTGDQSFERAAKRAMNVLWQKRTNLNLVGSLFDTATREWKKDPNVASGGIGSGSDSFYEYLLKYYVLSGDLHYFDIWNEAYAAIVKYMKNDYWYVDVDIDTGLPSRNWVDSFQAFFPSLMVLTGDPANATHMYEAYHSMWRHYGLLPEVYHHTSQYLHMQNYPLRPELPESTWYLYQTTKDPYYLQVGAEIVDALQTHCRTQCGFAAIKEILSMEQEDQMDSFFLSETLKYLYLLFDTENFVNKGNYVFNTEGHMFPIKRKFMGITPPASSPDVAAWGEDVGATKERQDYVNKKYRQATCPTPLFFEHEKFVSDQELEDKYYYWATAFQEEPLQLLTMIPKSYAQTV